MTGVARADLALQSGKTRHHYVWVDNAKALLIFLVVLGHFHYDYAPVLGKNMIYAFHVPAFLLLTGFLLPADFGRLPAMAVMRRWVLLYVRAYAFFSVIAIAIWWAAESARAGGPVDPWSAIGGALYGVAGSGNGLVHQDQPLWYFPFLVSSLIGAWIAAALSERFSPLLGWGFVLAYAILAMVYSGPRLPWDIEIAGIGVVMILAGRFLRQNFSRVEPLMEQPFRSLLLAAVMLGLLFAISWLNGPTNINGANFGANGFLFIAGALAGSVAVMFLAAAIPATRLAEKISAQTLTIFALHIYLVRVAGALPVPDAIVLQQVIMVVLSALVVLACLPLATILQPLLRRLVDLRPANPQPRTAG